jgi:hypothetical protein
MMGNVIFGPLGERGSAVWMHVRVNDNKNTMRDMRNTETTKSLISRKRDTPKEEKKGVESRPPRRCLLSGSSTVYRNLSLPLVLIVFNVKRQKRGR